MGTQLRQMVLMIAAYLLLTPVLLWAGTIELPRTGQTTSYDANTPQRDDGAIKAGVAWPDPRFTDNGDQTVKDNLTGLEWTKDANAPGPAACSTGTTKTWQGALDHVACLNTNNYLGHNDWRLPNRLELDNLFNAEQSNSVTWLNGQGFANVQAYWYWSSSTLAGYSSGAWIVGMWDGDVDVGSKSGLDGCVWPVRAGQSGSFDNLVILLPKTGQTTSYAAGDDGDLEKGMTWPNPRFTNPDSTTPISGNIILDGLTGLEWPKDAGTPTISGTPTCTGGQMTWQGALDYVACLNTNNYLGHNDWRLPNRLELESFFNAGQSNSAIWLNGQGFANVQSFNYWSSTTYADSTNDASYVDMPNGRVNSYYKTSSYYVWPVRGGQSGSSGNLVLTVSKTGTGSGTVVSVPSGISCGSTCSASFVSGATVTLTATADSGSSFASWTGCDSTSSNTCSVSMTAAKTVTATFTLDDSTNKYTLTVIKAGAGTGTIASDVAGISCPGDCSEPYAKNTTVILTATPAQNSSFKAWKGCTSTSGTTCTVSMTAAKTVTATFTLDKKYTLKVIKAGTGTGTIASDVAGISCPGDCSEPYAKNTTVILTATPAQNSSFKAWKGCTSTSGTTCTVSMTAAKTVTATFTATAPLPSCAAIPPCCSTHNGIQVVMVIVPDKTCNCPPETTYVGMDNITPGGPWKMCTCNACN